MKKARIIVLVGASAGLFVQPLAAQELSYHLPEGTAVAGYKWQIKKCPTLEDTSVIIDSGGTVKGSYSKGPLVRLDPRSSFLSSRKITLTYHDNGMLKTINAQGEGKGGAVLSSILQTAVGYAGLSELAVANAPEQLASECQSHVKAKVDRWNTLVQRISQFEGKIAAGETLSTIEKAVYDSYITEKTALDKALTITVAAKKFDGSPLGTLNTDQKTYVTVKKVGAPKFDT